MLAVGIVVDDAIVVVENVERNIAAGMTPKEAAHRTMDEVGGALVSIALTLCAVFVPSAFLSGISGQFFRQFAVTIAASTVISLLRLAHPQPGALRAAAASRTTRIRPPAAIWRDGCLRAAFASLQSRVRADCRTPMAR